MSSRRSTAGVVSGSGSPISKHPRLHVRSTIKTPQRRRIGSRGGVGAVRPRVTSLTLPSTVQSPKRAHAGTNSHRRSKGYKRRKSSRQLAGDEEEEEDEVDEDDERELEENEEEIEEPESPTSPTAMGRIAKRNARAMNVVDLAGRRRASYADNNLVGLLPDLKASELRERCPMLGKMLHAEEADQADAPGTSSSFNRGEGATGAVIIGSGDLISLQHQLEALLAENIDNQQALHGEITYLTSGEYPKLDMSNRPMPVYTLLPKEEAEQASIGSSPASGESKLCYNRRHGAKEIESLPPELGRLLNSSHDDEGGPEPHICEVPQRFWRWSRGYFRHIGHEYVNEFHEKLVERFSREAIHKYLVDSDEKGQLHSISPIRGQVSRQQRGMDPGDERSGRRMSLRSQHTNEHSTANVAAAKPKKRISSPPQLSPAHAPASTPTSSSAFTSHAANLSNGVAAVKSRKVSQENPPIGHQQSSSTKPPRSRREEVPANSSTSRHAKTTFLRGDSDAAGSEADIAAAVAAVQNSPCMVTLIQRMMENVAAIASNGEQMAADRRRLSASSTSYSAGVRQPASTSSSSQRTRQDRRKLSSTATMANGGSASVVENGLPAPIVENGASASSFLPTPLGAAHRRRSGLRSSTHQPAMAKEEEELDYAAFLAALANGEDIPAKGKGRRGSGVEAGAIKMEQLSWAGKRPSTTPRQNLQNSFRPLLRAANVPSPNPSMKSPEKNGRISTSFAVSSSPGSPPILSPEELFEHQRRARQTLRNKKGAAPLVEATKATASSRAAGSERFFERAINDADSSRLNSITRGLIVIGMRNGIIPSGSRNGLNSTAVAVAAAAACNQNGIGEEKDGLDDRDEVSAELRRKRAELAQLHERTAPVIARLFELVEAECVLQEASHRVDIADDKLFKLAAELESRKSKKGGGLSEKERKECALVRKERRDTLKRLYPWIASRTGNGGHGGDGEKSGKNRERGHSKHAPSSSGIGHIRGSSPAKRN